MKRIAIIATVVTSAVYAAHVSAKVWCCHTDWWSILFGL